MTDINSLCGSAWIKFDPNYSKESLIFKPEYFRARNGREYKITLKRLNGDVLLEGAKIEGAVLFKGVEKVYYEPNEGWTLGNFMDAITDYQKKWRIKENNYFLGGYDYHHTIFAGMNKIDRVYEIVWDS